MGSWAVHSFGNDDAADWLLELEEQDDLAFVRGTIAEVLEADGYLEATYAAQALAAIEVVAATLGKPTTAARNEKELMAWVKQGHLHPEPTLVAAAVRAIDRIVADESELRELWQDSTDYAAWQANVAELRAKLTVQ